MLSITADPMLAMRAPVIPAWMAVILLVAYVPELVLWLPRSMR